MIDLTFTEVSKKYRIRSGPTRPSLSEWIRSGFSRNAEFWALKNVSFDVPRGQTLGIIGPNGAGKSTILKLLSSITAPTRGTITIKGRLSALIEVGSGFHPELTGRENIFLSGSILGMRRREIAENLDSIVDFAGVDQFIDTPVKRYSSGMYVRLGFSIAAHLNPDILLLDEVLAVGDAAFQARCFSRIEELKSSGKTIVFISHDLSAIELLCDRVLLLEKGNVVDEGEPHDIIVAYQRRTAATQQLQKQNGSLTPILITRVGCTDEQGCELSACYSGTQITFRAEYEARVKAQDLIFEIFFYSADQRLQGILTTDDEEIGVGAGSGFVEFACNELRLPAGLYFLDATIRRRNGQEIDWRYRCATLFVKARRSSAESASLPCEWRVVEHQPLHLANQRK